MSDCVWSLPGLFGFNDSYYFGLKDKVDIYGSPLVMWNGGRPWGNVKASLRPELLLNFEDMLLEYKNRNISTFYTWSNWLLEEKHLSDKICNLFLDKLWEINGEDGGIIVSSETLYKYIKDRYPKLRFKASVEKTEAERKVGNINWYRDLADKYDIVNIHQDDGFNDVLLEALSKNADKYEILINERCRRSCPYRRREHEIWSKMFTDKNFFQPMLPADKTWYDENVAIDCYCKPGVSEKCPVKDCIFDEDRFKKVYDMGYRRFKLGGRGWEISEIVSDIEKFMSWIPKIEEGK